MAVYTDITDDELAAFLADYDLGQAVAFKGIAEGVENSNFLLETESGRFILTVYERRADRPGRNSTRAAGLPRMVFRVAPARSAIGLALG